ncbi:MAG: hypothetical protein HRT88_04980 [Lentisphaeraceae bacterium]|nr:hypothetical protein [Lentisphaeraceae bacterium]
MDFGKVSSILEPLYAFFSYLGFFVLFLGATTRMTDKNADWADQLRFYAFCALLAAAVHYYPTIINEGYDLTEAFAQDTSEEVEKMYAYAAHPSKTDWGWRSFQGKMGELCAAFGGLMASTAQNLLWAVTHVILRILVVVSPLLIPMLAFSPTQSIGVRFVNYTLLLVLMPISIALIDVMAGEFLVHSIDFFTFSPDSVDAKIVKEIKSQNYAQAGMPVGNPSPFLYTILTSVLGASAVGYVFSPMIFSKLLQGAGIHTALTAAAKGAVTGGTAGITGAAAGAKTASNLVGGSAAGQAAGKFVGGNVSKAATMLGNLATKGAEKANSTGAGKAAMGAGKVAMGAGKAAMGVTGAMGAIARSSASAAMRSIKPPPPS